MRELRYLCSQQPRHRSSLYLQRLCHIGYLGERYRFRERHPAHRPGCCIGAHDGGYRGFRLANSNITRGPGRLISTASDALDVTMQADVIVENNNIGYQGDDSVVISPTVMPVIGVDGAEIRTTG